MSGNNGLLQTEKQKQKIFIYKDVKNNHSSKNITIFYEIDKNLGYFSSFRMGGNPDYKFVSEGVLKNRIFISTLDIRFQDFRYKILDITLLLYSIYQQN